MAELTSRLGKLPLNHDEEDDDEHHEPRWNSVGDADLESPPMSASSIPKRPTSVNSSEAEDEEFIDLTSGVGDGSTTDGLGCGSQLCEAKKKSWGKYTRTRTGACGRGVRMQRIQRNLVDGPDDSPPDDVNGTVDLPDIVNPPMIDPTPAEDPVQPTNGGTLSSDPSPLYQRIHQSPSQTTHLQMLRQLQATFPARSV